MYVIRYELNPQSYFKHMTVIGPAFGGTIENTPRYASTIEAQDVINAMPMVAALCCKVVPLLDCVTTEN